MGDEETKNSEKSTEGEKRASSAEGLPEEGDEETAEFSMRPAQVKLRGEDSQSGELASPNQLARRAKEVCVSILRYFPLKHEPRVKLSWDEEAIYLQIEGDGSGLLIGRKGQTLDALQYLVNKIVNRKVANKMRVEVDTEGYRQRRRGQLTSLARKAADDVRAEGVPVSLEPMTAAERRIVHMALRDHPDVITQSEGSQDERRVVVKPRLNK